MPDFGAPARSNAANSSGSNYGFSRYQSNPGTIGNWNTGGSAYGSGSLAGGIQSYGQPAAVGGPKNQRGSGTIPMVQPPAPVLPSGTATLWGGYPTVNPSGTATMWGGPSVGPMVSRTRSPGYANWGAPSPTATAPGKGDFGGNFGIGGGGFGQGASIGPRSPSVGTAPGGALADFARDWVGGIGDAIHGPAPSSPPQATPGISPSSLRDQYSQYRSTADFPVANEQANIDARTRALANQYSQYRSPPGAAAPPVATGPVDQSSVQRHLTMGKPLGPRGLQDPVGFDTRDPYSTDIARRIAGEQPRMGGTQVNNWGDYAAQRERRTNDLAGFTGLGRPGNFGSLGSWRVPGNRSRGLGNRSNGSGSVGGGHGFGGGGGGW